MILKILPFQPLIIHNFDDKNETKIFVHRNAKKNTRGKRSNFFVFLP